MDDTDRDEGFERVGLAHVIARIQPPNVASARVAERIGMRVDRETTGRSGEALRIYTLDCATWRELRGRRAPAGATSRRPDERRLR